MAASSWGVALSVFVPPVPASRPRVTRWGTYYGKTYKAYMADSETAIPKATAKLTGNLHVDVDFVCSRPKTTKLSTPKGDIDNHLKAILDVITKQGYWHDDVQIESLTATKRFAVGTETPHTHIRIKQA